LGNLAGLQSKSASCGSFTLQTVDCKINGVQIISLFFEKEKNIFNPYREIQNLGEINYENTK
jgi:hypothetical protein